MGVARRMNPHRVDVSTKPPIVEKGLWAIKVLWKEKSSDSRAKIFEEPIHFCFTDVGQLLDPISARSSPKHAEHAEEQQVQGNRFPATDVTIVFSSLSDPISNPLKDMFEKTKRNTEAPIEKFRLVGRGVAKPIKISLHHTAPGALRVHGTSASVRFSWAWTSPMISFLIGCCEHGEHDGFVRRGRTHAVGEHVVIPNSAFEIVNPSKNEREQLMR
jgi:hypothetical protein